MIFVTLGTQDNSFERLIKEIEKCIDNGFIREEVIVQLGHTKYNSNRMKLYDFLSQNKMNEFIKKSNYIITHGGVGSIIGALKQEKKVIAVSRKKEYKEHVNNHQMQIVENFNETGYIIGIDDISKLQDAIKKIPSFAPNKYKSNNTNFINIISEYIDNN